MLKTVFDGIVVKDANISTFKGRRCVIFKIYGQDVKSETRENNYYSVVSFGDRKSLMGYIKFRDNNRFLLEGTIRRTRLTDELNVLDSKKYIDLHDATFTSKSQ